MLSEKESLVSNQNNLEEVLSTTGFRKPVVGSSHIAQWSLNEFSVVSLLTGKSDVKISLIERKVAWTVAGGGSVREEKTWDLVISKENKSSDHAQGIPIVLGNFLSFYEAHSEFQRVSDDLLKDFFPGHLNQPSETLKISNDPSKTGFLKRAVRTTGPWFGGAVLVIVVALIIPSASKEGVHSHEGDIGAAPGTNLNERAPAAWEKLSQENKDILNKISEQAARDYVAKGQGGAQQQPPSPKPDLIKSLDDAQMLKLKSLYSLKIGSGDKTLFAFEDPLCSACKDFSTQARNLPKDFGVVVLPIAFQNGARDIAATALCSADPQATWSKLMSGILGASKPCDEGYKIIDSNNAAFIEFGFRATPALVAQNSTVVIGSMDTAELAQWVAANGKK